MEVYKLLESQSLWGENACLLCDVGYWSESRYPYEKITQNRENKSIQFF